MAEMTAARARLRELLRDPDAGIWSDAELDGHLAAHRIHFAGIRLGRHSGTVFAWPDGRWVWADDPAPVIKVGGVEIPPQSVDPVARSVTFAEAVPEGVPVVAEFVACNLYYAAADAKLAASGDPEKQQAIVSQGRVRLSDRSPSEQLREEAEALRRLGMPSVVRLARQTANGPGR